MPARPEDDFRAAIPLPEYRGLYYWRPLRCCGIGFFLGLVAMPILFTVCTWLSGFSF
jgi:hypothetical protein